MRGSPDHLTSSGRERLPSPFTNTPNSARIKTHIIKFLYLAEVESVVFTVEAEQQLEWLLFFRHQHNFEREAVVLLRAVDGERQTRVGFVEEFWKNKTEEITASSTCTCTCTIMQNRTANRQRRLS